MTKTSPQTAKHSFYPSVKNLISLLVMLVGLVFIPQISQAREIHEVTKKCDKGDKRACIDAAQYYWRMRLLSKWMGSDTTRPITEQVIHNRALHHKKMCTKGNKRSCYMIKPFWYKIFVGEFRAKRTIRPFLPFNIPKKTITKYQDKACSAGHIEACFKWRFLAEPKYEPYINRLCRLGRPAYCLVEAVFHDKLDKLEAINSHKALILKICQEDIDKTCFVDDIHICRSAKRQSCSLAARMYKHTAYSHDKFVHFAKMACRARSSKNCLQAAKHTKDEQEKIRLLHASCKGYDENGCFALAELLRKRGHQVDGDNIVKLYTKVCHDEVKNSNNNYIQACYVLAKLYKEGFFVPKNIRASTQTYKQACDHGDKVACLMQYSGWIFILPPTLLHIVMFVLVFFFLLRCFDGTIRWIRRDIFGANPTQANFNIHVCLAFLLTCICILLHIFPTHKVDYHSTLRLPEAIIFAVIIIVIWKRIGFFSPIIYSVFFILLSNPAQHVASSMWAAKDHIIGGRFDLLLMSLQTDILQKVQTPISIISVLIIVYFIPRLVYWMLTNTEIHKLFIPNLQEEIEFEVNQKRLKISIGSVLCVIPWTLNVKYGEQEYPALYFLKRPLVFTWTYSLGTCLLDEHTELEVIAHSKIIGGAIGEEISIKINGERLERTWLTYKNARKYITQYCLFTTLLLLLLIYLSP